MQELLSLADELGIIVVERRGLRLGGYHDRSSTIRLNPDMPRRVARSVLAHEIAHHVFADQHSQYGPVNAKQERRADEWAALHLIRPEAFAEAEQHRNGHGPSMAFDLSVTVEIVEAFKRVLLRVGDTVFVDPKMGAGQFAHRTEVA